MYYENKTSNRAYYRFYFCGSEDSTEPRFAPPHCHDEYELLIVTNGEVEAVLEGERRELHAGDILFIDSYEVHSLVFRSAERYSLVFSKDYCRMLADEKTTLPRYPKCDEASFLKIKACLKEYVSIYGENNPNGLLIESLVAYILGTIESCSGRVQKTDRTNELMSSILDYINKNSTEELTLSDISTRFGYSVNYFSSLFNKYVGMSFSDYLNYVRYTRAADIILLQGCTATDIAMKCGFGSMNTFYRAKNKYDCKA